MNKPFSNPNFQPMSEDGQAAYREKIALERYQRRQREGWLREVSTATREPEKKGVSNER